MLARMSTYELEVDDSGAPDTVVASLSGELDLTNAVELEEQLRDAAPDESILVLDVSRVVFIDSAVLHILFRLARMRGEGRLVLVLEPSSPIARVLDIVAMKDAVRVVPSLADA
jgi:anti-anti-sigma factor